MKKSFKKRYHLLLAILLGIIILQSGLILFTLHHASSLHALTFDIQTILIIFFFIIFVYLIVIYSYIPFRLRKALGEIERLIEEISQGNYQIDIDSSIYDQDADIQRLIIALQKMLNILLRFDNAKADKIFEHHQRITQLINILPQGIIIASSSGDVVYCNDAMRRAYPSISEEVNIGQLIFANSFDSQLFNVLNDAMRNDNNLNQQLLEDTKSQRKAYIDSTMIRNRKGMATGSVFVIKILDNETKN